MDDPQAFTALVADKGYHSNEVMVDLQAVGVRSYVAEPDRGRREWSKAREAQAPVSANRRRIRGARGKRLMRRRGERIERSFAHAYETGGMRRTHLRGHRNILKRLLIHLAGFNLGCAVPAADRRWHAAQPAGALSRRADGPCVLLGGASYMSGPFASPSTPRVPRSGSAITIDHSSRKPHRKTHFHHGLLGRPAERADQPEVVPGRAGGRGVAVVTVEED